jgi:hypothetical protein
MATPGGDETRSPTLAAIDLGQKDASSNTSRTPSISPAHSLQDTVLAETPTDADSPETANEFKPTWRFYLTFISLSVITLTAALDATSKFAVTRRVPKSLWVVII